MKKTIKTIFSSILILLTLASCSKWLEVQPEDQFTEDQIYNSATGFEEALNGVYLTLGEVNLYGEKLTLTILEALAQRYYALSDNHVFYNYIHYDYTEEDAEGGFSEIWSDAYVGIANVNQLIENIDRQNDVLSSDRAKTMKGEALGLRAFIHFDLLRLFGPVYDSADSTKTSIPYYTTVEPDIVDFFPANDVVDMLLQDIEQALVLLDTDPVKTEGSENLNRYRFNYYAVQALKARVLLWRKDRQGAFDAAQTVIQHSDLFPWIEASKITGDSQNPDRIFSTELLFSVYSGDLYDSYQDYFYYELGSSSILAAGTSNYINVIYENQSNDYRKDYMWKVPPVGASYATFFKYADIVTKDSTETQRNTIPVIRLSELYYIAAETASDQTEALGYINTVRNHRGLPSLASTSSLTDEILKEYRKEFYGEGQLWYYYKRNKISSVLSPNNDNNYSIPSTAWVPSIPEEELSQR